jgi:predicted transcriptional regulator of viral defense system
MNFVAFQNTFKSFPLIPVSDILKHDPGFDTRRLVEWQNKGYIEKIKNGFYYFTHQQKNEMFYFLAASKIYKPAYVSLESALSYHGLIPEGVFSVTAITTNNTATFHSKLCRFYFRHLKASLFFGYNLLKYNEFHINMAEPEKALLDYLYLQKPNTAEALSAMRLNKIITKELFGNSKMNDYLGLFNSPAMNRRLMLLQKIIND